MIDAPVIAVTDRNKRANKSKPFIFHRVFAVKIAGWDPETRGTLKVEQKEDLLLVIN